MSPEQSQRPQECLGRPSIALVPTIRSSICRWLVCDQAPHSRMGVGVLQPRQYHAPQHFRPGGGGKHRRPALFLGPQGIGVSQVCQQRLQGGNGGPISFVPRQFCRGDV